MRDEYVAFFFSYSLISHLLFVTNLIPHLKLLPHITNYDVFSPFLYLIDSYELDVLFFSYFYLT